MKTEATKELTTQGCFIPNCMQRFWTIRNRDKSTSGNLAGFYYNLHEHTKVLIKEEVELYTIINFFAEVGGYLGLLLGESLLSYLITTSKWFQILGRKLKEQCRKADEEPESSPA